MGRLVASPVMFLAELAAQRVKIAKDPTRWSALGIGGEEGSTGVFETPMRSCQPQQRSGMRTGVPQPCGRPLAVTVGAHVIAQGLRSRNCSAWPAP